MTQIDIQAPEDAPVAVGLSMKSGTCVVAVDLSHSLDNIQQHHRLQRGHTILAVDGHAVDHLTVGKYLRDGLVGSLVKIRARDESDHEFDVELQRQYGPFGKACLLDFILNYY